MNNTKKTRNLITSVILALLVALALFTLYVGSKEVVMSFGVVAALAILGGIELHGAARQLSTRLPKGASELYRSFKSKA